MDTQELFLPLPSTIFMRNLRIITSSDLWELESATVPIRVGQFASGGDMIWTDTMRVEFVRPLLTREVMESGVYYDCEVGIFRWSRQTSRSARNVLAPPQRAATCAHPRLPRALPGAGLAAPSRRTSARGARWPYISMKRARSTKLKILSLSPANRYPRLGADRQCRFIRLPSGRHYETGIDSRCREAVLRRALKDYSPNHQTIGRLGDRTARPSRLHRSRPHRTDIYGSSF